MTVPRADIADWGIERKFGEVFDEHILASLLKKGEASASRGGITDFEDIHDMHISCDPKSKEEASCFAKSTALGSTFRNV
jgi:hypothetical protein